METKQNKTKEKQNPKAKQQKRNKTPPVFVLSEMSKEYFWIIIFLLKHKTKQRKIVFLD